MTSDVIDTTAVVVSDQPAHQAVTLFQTDDPAEVVTKATAVANALAGVIRRQGLASNISGKEYVRVEGWTLLGSMLGVFPVEDWTRPIEYEGKVVGYEARVEARRGDQVVGAAESMCLRAEGGNWGKATDNALRSMAQTRATSKAMRLPLGFVMQLAGYQVTPAEEVTWEEERHETPRPRGAPPITDKQAAYVVRLMGELHDHLGTESDGFFKMLSESYPHAKSDKGKFMAKGLKINEASEVIDMLRQAIKDAQMDAKGTGEVVDLDDVPNE